MSLIPLESFAVGFLGITCVFYGVYGVVLTCTAASPCPCTDTLSADLKSCKDGKTDDAAVPFSPLTASMYSSAAMILGYIIWEVRDTVGDVSQSIATVGSQLRTRTVEGAAQRSFSWRLLIILAFSLFIIFVLLRGTLLGKLKTCPRKDVSKAPLMFSIRETMEQLEGWLLGLGFLFLGGFLAVSVSETFLREGYKKREELGQSTEDYSAAAAWKDKYNYWTGQTTSKELSAKDHFAASHPLPQHASADATHAGLQAPHAGLSPHGASPHHISSPAQHLQNDARHMKRILHQGSSPR